MVKVSVKPITDAQLLKLDWNAVSVLKSTVFWGVCNTLLMHCGQKLIVNHLNYEVFLLYYVFFYYDSFKILFMIQCLA